MVITGDRLMRQISTTNHMEGKGVLSPRPIFYQLHSLGIEASTCLCILLLWLFL